MSQPSYLVFQFESQEMPYTFLYPADWQAREIVEEDYVEAFIVGPRDQEDTFSVGFTVRISPASPQTLEEAMIDLLNRFGQMPGFREVGRGSGLVAERPAVEVEFAHNMLLPLNNLDPHKKTIRQRYVFLKDNDTLAELIYVAPDEMYDAWLPDFRTLVQNFRRTEKRDDTVFRSLIGVPDIAVVRETTTDYKVEERTEDE